MKILLFGATGMVGQGALRECLADPDVTEILAIGRTLTAEHQAKYREIVHADLFDFASLESQLGGFDACLFCLGVSSAGLSEAEYRRVTYDITLAAARTLARLNPLSTFIYVSGAGTDSSERGRSMWARVKGQTENALLALPFRAAYMLRPALIQPRGGIRSKTRSYRILYSAMALLLPTLRRLFPNYVTSTQELGRAMLNLAKHADAKAVVEARDINRLAATDPS